MSVLGLEKSIWKAAAVMGISIIISRLFFSKDEILCFASSFSNPGFFGIPLITAILSNGAVFYVASFIVFVNLLQWSYGVALLTAKESQEKGGWKKYIPSPKRLFTAPFMIACLIGLFFFFSGLKVPNIMRQCVQYIANLNTPLAMFTIGIYLAQTNVFHMLKKKKLYLLSAVRLLIIPIVSLIVLTLIPQQYEEMRMALLIVAACPVGSNVAVYAQLYDNDYVYSVETVIMSTLFSIVTMPIVVQLAQYL